MQWLFTQQNVSGSWRMPSQHDYFLSPNPIKPLPRVKVAGDPNNSVHFKDDASAEELRAEIERRLNILLDAGIIELKSLPAPEVQ